MNNLEAIIKEVVKEALREVLAELNLNTVPVVKEEAKAVAPVETVKEEVKAPVVEPKKEEVAKAEEPKKAKAPVVKEEVTSSDNGMTKADLDSKTYNEIKAIAKDLGIKAVGTKAILIEKILEASTESEDVAEEEVEEVTESHEDEKVLLDEDEDPSEDEEEGEPTLYDRVVAELDGTTDEELADILSDIGISPKGKRQALLTKIVQAIEEGKLEFDTDEAEDDGEEVEEVESEEVMEAKKVTEEEFDEEEENITPEREEAMEEVEHEILSAYENMELTDKEIASFLEEYKGGEYLGANKKQNLDNYVAIHCALVDDEGEIHELKDPYFIGETVLCCANDLKELDNGNLYCEVCGQEYESEE